MMARRSQLLAILAALLICGCSLKAMFTPMHLDNYRGDGTISHIHFLPNPGVLVEFEPFPLSKPYHAQFRLDGLPRRPFPYFASLVVPYPDDFVVSKQLELFRVPGTLDLALVRDDGTTVFRCQGVPSWSGVFGGTFSDAEAEFAKCDGTRGNQPYILPDDLEPQAQSRLLLEVSWSPGQGALDVKGRIKLRSGGST